MIRYNLYLSEREVEELKKECDEKDISMAELIRRILDERIEQRKEIKN